MKNAVNKLCEILEPVKITNESLLSISRSFTGMDEEYMNIFIHPRQVVMHVK